MSRRFVPVDEQIDQFEDLLSHQLGTSLINSINLQYWRELNEQDAPTLQRISDLIQVPFDHLLRAYDGSRVGVVLRLGATLLKAAARVALNVPCPEAAVLHVAQVSENLFEIYIEHIYANLRTEMMMLNHSAQVIQRNWRRAFFVPTHPMCRRRLLREAAELEKLIEDMTVQ